MKQALMLRFGGTRYDNPFKALKILQQLGTMEDYIETFEFVSSQVPKLTEQQYVGYFMGGLKAEIRQRVHTFRPTSRWQVMQLARDVESELEGTNRIEGQFLGRSGLGNYSGRFMGNQSKGRGVSYTSQGDAAGYTKTGSNGIDPTWKLVLVVPGHERTGLIAQHTQWDLPFLTLL